MYSWAQRKDCQVFDEPLYAHYLRSTGIAHPGRTEILAEMENDGAKVVQDTILHANGSPVLFFKQMTHHLVDLDDSFLGACKNILFIRNPIEIIHSYAKVIGQPRMEDIGVKMQYDLWQKWGTEGKIHAVLDSKFLLQNPRRVLEKLCAALEIPFDEAMLSWEAGPRPEDGVWAKYWYANVHRSNGFAPYQAKNIELPESLQALAEACQPYYEFLSAKSIY